MRFPNLFRRNQRKKNNDDLPSVLDFETTEALASALAGVPMSISSHESSHSSSDDSITTTGSAGSRKGLVVDWKLPIYDATNTKDQTIEHELERLVALQSYNILENEQEQLFDQITNLAADIYQAPIAIINLVDLSRTWFVSGHGTGDIKGTPRSMSFCAHVVQSKTNDVLVVPDVTKDYRFKDFAIVTGPPYIRFYAGAPLITPDGYKIGSLCIMDVVPRKHGLMDFEIEILSDLARDAMNIINQRREKMKKFDIGVNQDSKYFGKAFDENLELLLGPPVTNMDQLVQSINTLMETLPKKVPIAIEFDTTNVQSEIECKDIILLRTTLLLLNHAAGRTEVGSIQLRIQMKKTCVLFECEDTGPYISSIKNHKKNSVEKFIDSLPKTSTFTAMATMIRSMHGDCGIYTTENMTTVSWFTTPPNNNRHLSNVFGKNTTNKPMRTVHPPNVFDKTNDTESVDNMMTSKMKRLDLSKFSVVGDTSACLFGCTQK